MPAITTRLAFEAELKRLIAETIENMRDQLESVQPEATTAFKRGQIFGLRQIEDLMVQAQENIDKR